LLDILDLIAPVDDELPELPIEHGMLDKLKKRIQVARQIDSANHKVKKDNHEKSWVKEAAEALELDMEDEDVCVSFPFCLRFLRISPAPLRPADTVSPYRPPILLSPCD
jgi:hypothetical protein